MIVVSDTSAITNLIAIGRVELLRDLFAEVQVPAAVGRELRAAHSQIPEFLREVVVQNERAVRELTADQLDEGEAEAIVLAEESNADFLLIDESAGRSVARQRGLPIIGLIGVLRQAKDERLITTIGPLIDALVHEAGFWISPSIREQALRDAGEAAS